MGMIRELLRRFLYLFQRRRFDRELEEEMRFHLDSMADRRQFGNPTLLQEVSRDMWGWSSVEQLLQDLRYGVRMLLKSPGDVEWLVLRDSLLLLAAGAPLGIAASLPAAGFVGTLLYGVRPVDPVTIAVALGVLFGVALFAAWLPARRASRVDPLTALKYE